MAVNMNPQAVLDRVKAAAMAGVLDGAERVRETAIASMLTSKGGRHYPGNPRRSSAPGEAPARQTGRLAGGIDIRAEVADLKAVVNAGTAYAAALEFGTERIAPRPFMRPALASNKAAIEADIEARVAEALK